MTLFIPIPRYGLMMSNNLNWQNDQKTFFNYFFVILFFNYFFVNYLEMSISKIKLFLCCFQYWRGEEFCLLLHWRLLIYVFVWKNTVYSDYACKYFWEKLLDNRYDFKVISEIEKSTYIIMFIFQNPEHFT